MNSPSLPALEEQIGREIDVTGSIRFERFMELALYHPEHGYYARDGKTNPVGRGGDFFTSVSVGPLFGWLLARQFFQMWQLLGKGEPFWIVEQGAHDGQLALDILDWAGRETPDFFEALRYGIVEPSAAARAAQQRRLEAFDLRTHLAWFGTIEEVAAENPAGVFFSNELVDAFPVRLVTRQEEAWKELHVARGTDGLTWRPVPIDDPELARAVVELGLPPIEGYTTEIHLRARDWVGRWGIAWRRGYALTLDYGFPASVYYAPFRGQGTLTAYHQHRRTADVLTAPGTRDLTAHVDFTSLARAAEAVGWTALGLVDQQRFLMGIAHDEFSGAAGPRAGVAENRRAWNTLTHPEYLGARFQALVLAKDAPAELDGLRYARPGGLD